MKIARGIRRVPRGYQAYLRVHGRLYTKSFAADATLKDMKHWREQTRARAKFGIVTSDDGGTFADDVQTYLAIIVAQPSAALTKTRLRRWVQEFGDRPRSEIRAVEIRAALERWRIGGHLRTRRGLSAGALNRYRGVLMSLYTTLDGRSQPNPVKDVPPYDESASADILRAQPITTWYRLLARMVHPVKVPYKPMTRVTDDDVRMQARLRLMLWTGWPHTLIGAITPADIHREAATVRVVRRKKGRGTPARTIPVVPPAMVALEQMAALQAFGPFSSSRLNAVLARAWRHENRWRAQYGHAPLPHVRPIDARHTFNTLLAAAVTDERARETMTVTQQRRYSEGAMAGRMAEARDQFAARLARTTPAARILQHLPKRAMR